VCNDPALSRVGPATGDEVEVLDEAATAVDDAASCDELADPGLDGPKLPDAVVDVPLETSTFLTITISPSILETFTSTVAVPKPLEYSKKL